MDEKLLLVKYQDQLADNLSIYANAQITADKHNLKCCYENISDARNHFEQQMDCFNLKCRYISQNRASEINEKIPLNKNKINKNYYINDKCFDLNNMFNISNELISQFQFKNTNFILNHDLLESIITDNSIGLYIHKHSYIDENFIQDATKRLNKYLKQPILYIFTKNNYISKINLDIKYKIIDIDNPKEEFYMLHSCKHKIIYTDANSHSQGFWASFLNQKEYCYVIYNKKIKLKNKKHNWIAI